MNEKRSHLHFFKCIFVPTNMMQAISYQAFKHSYEYSNEEFDMINLHMKTSFHFICSMSSISREQVSQQKDCIKLDHNFCLCIFYVQSNQLGFLHSFFSHLRRHHYKIEFNPTYLLQNGHYGFQGRDSRLDRILTKKQHSLWKHQFSFESFDFQSKIYLILYFFLGNLTTHIAIPSRLKAKRSNSSKKE